MTAFLTSGDSLQKSHSRATYTMLHGLLAKLRRDRAMPYIANGRRAPK
jgi:hypothetical protein